ncbi:lamin tail domain-containing protein [Streptomyces sp. NPDC002073]|uniref:lamin tail domain-containing protein n=1 Tax=Streptomyces sp. NBC_00239 TaxID=2903640 RepID=UPI002E284253|nr:lamin tail domain-containing protein [Streptomyces sp. NBC_00239]
MRITRPAALTLAAVALLGALGTAPASAAAGDHVHSVHFGKISFDSPGRDTNSARSRNGEWIDIHNYTRRTVNLQGWSVHNDQGNQYTFRSYVLRAGETVRLHTGPGRTTGSGGTKLGHVYWNASGHRWHNKVTNAFLYRPGATSYSKWCRSGTFWGHRSPGNCHEIRVA